MRPIFGYYLRRIRRSSAAGYSAQERRGSGNRVRFPVEESRPKAAENRRFSEIKYRDNLLRGILFFSWKRILFLCVLVALISGTLIVVQRRSPGVTALISACEAKGPLTQQCLNDLVLSEAKDNGIGAGFDALAAAYAQDPEFAEYCHGSTHELGKMAYKNFKEGRQIGLSSKTSYCGFGFFHGFMEMLLEDSGDIDGARKFCDYVDEQLKGSVSGVTFACYHGMGHGVVDGSDPSKWGDTQKYIEPGIALCEKLGTTDEQKNWCASGVFNALAIALRDPKYRLPIDPKDAYAFCRAQQKSYLKISCYDQMNSYFVETTKTFLEALDKSSRSASKEEGQAPHAIESVANYEVFRALSSKRPYATYVSDCSTLERTLADSCATGFASGLIEFGRPGAEYDEALKACKAAGTHTAACIEGMVLGVHDRLKIEVQQKLCEDVQREFSDAFAQECRGIMDGTYKR